MKADAIRAIAVIAAHFPNAKFPEVTVDAWANSLANVEPAILMAAVTELCETSTFPPSLAEIRSAALAQALPNEPTAEGAWGDVLDAISSFGGYRLPEFNDPDIMPAIRCISGWSDLCASNVSDMPSHRARFIEAYRGIASRRRNKQLTSPIKNTQIPESL